MNDKEKKKLLKEIARIAERSYRRGFQHGFLVAYADGGSEKAEGIMAIDGQKISPKQIEDWRFNKNREKYSVCPPGTKFSGKKDEILERLKIEMNDIDCPLIKGLL